MKPPNNNTGSVPQLPPAAIEALHRGNKIEAIKIVRMEHHCELKNAKDAVEAYVATQPALQSAMAQAQKEGLAAMIKWLAVLILAGLVAYHLLAK